MSSWSYDTQRAIAVALAGIVMLAGLWAVVISPKRSDSNAAGRRVAAQQANLDQAVAGVAANERARQQFPALRTQLRKLDVAVPARGDIAKLLRSLQTEAHRRGAALRIVTLKPGAAAPAGTVPPLTTGAVAGTGGLSMLPFDLQFTGRYFDLLHLLRTVRRAVSEKDGKVVARGRLMTIDGLAFTRSDPSSPVTVATLNATAYIASDTAATPAAPTTTGVAAAAAAPANTSAAVTP